VSAIERQTKASKSCGIQLAHLFENARCMFFPNAGGSPWIHSRIVTAGFSSS
jgi:hypothetical protein